jgi:methionyl-tRNA synthetase
VDLRAAKIIDVKRHPDAEKLYVETIDLGTEKRTIVSGLVPHYKEEELLGRTIVLVANLKPALLRGVESQGMLLAASEGKTTEVLFVDGAKPGDRILLSGGPSAESPAQIDIDSFFAMPIAARDSRIVVGDAELVCGEKPVVTTRVSKGRVK